MNVVDLEHGLIGCFGIVGGTSPPPRARRSRRSATGGVAVAFFGDGATNQGYFHECLNFAAVAALPVVFVCENNLYGEFTPMAAGHRRRRHRRPGAAPTTCPPRVVDGNDLWAVHAAAQEAVDRARGGGGPTLLECLTYRHYGHSKTTRRTTARGGGGGLDGARPARRSPARGSLDERRRRRTTLAALEARRRAR